MKTEQNKTEQYFKSRLDERTIQPSANAWDRLDAMLAVAEPEKKKSNKSWLYIAAGFILFMAVVALLMQQERNNNTIAPADNTVVIINETTTENVVQQDPVPVIKHEDINNINENNNTVPVKQQRAVATTHSPVVQHQDLQKKAVKQTGHVITNQNNNIDEAIAAVSVSAPAHTVNQTEENISEKKSHITVDAERLLAAVENSDTKNTEIVKNNKIKTFVNSDNLLSEVEGELNESFRSRVLQSAVKNYNAIKTSVANRNYQ